MIVMSKFATFDKEGAMQMPFPMHYVLDRDGRIVAKATGITGINTVRAELKKQLAARSVK